MTESVNLSISWINEAYPPNQADPAQFLALAKVKARQLADLYCSIMATLAAQSELKAAPAKDRPDIQDAFNRHYAKAWPQLDRAKPSEYLPAALRLALEHDGAEIRTEDRERAMLDLYALFEFWRFVAPRMQAAPAALLLPLGVAEFRLVSFLRHTQGAVYQIEVGTSFKHLSRGAAGSRGRQKINTPLRQTAAQVFEALSEKQKASFENNPGTVYSKFLEKAKALGATWGKRGDKAPVFNTWRNWIEEYLKDKSGP